MRVFYNEIDPFAADWLEQLLAARAIPDGVVDRRDIRDIHPRDLDGFDQCHFFAGIGGWALALQLAGWPGDRPVWTGSCPCLPFSSASRGRRAGFKDSRHLWPAWFCLIKKCLPPIVFGEQVAGSAMADAWLDQVCVDLESAGFAFGAARLPSCAVAADHIRERTWFLGHADSKGKSERAVDGEVARLSRIKSDAGSLVPPDGVSARMAVMRGFGNAIDPRVGAEFVRAASCF